MRYSLAALALFTGVSIAEEAGLPANSASLVEKLDGYADEQFEEAKDRIATKARLVIRTLQEEKASALQSERAGEAAAIEAAIQRIKTAYLLRPTSFLAQFEGTKVTYRGHTYALIEERVEWTEAMVRCEVVGGRLAVFPSQELATRIAQILPEGSRAWVGANDKDANGVWEWVDGTSPDPGAGLWEYDITTRKDHPVLTLKSDGELQPKGDGQFQSKDFIGFICEWTPEER